MFTPLSHHVWIRASSQQHSEERKWRKVVGSKAIGLTVLPSSWTPPFFVVDTSLYRKWLTTLASERSALLVPTAAIVASYISDRPGWAERGVVLRSSAVLESMSDRGAYQSLELPADFNDASIIQKIEEIFSAFEKSSVNDEIALIVQSRVHVECGGHLSNERRVSPTSNRWMWETESPQYTDGRFNSQRASKPDTDRPLSCKGRKALVALFRMVGRWCTQLNRGRAHLEWGYSSNVLWLFQIDFEDEQADQGVNPNVFLRASDSLPSGTLPTDSALHLADFKGQTGWSKIDKVKQFQDGRALPYPALFYLTGSELESALDRGCTLQAQIYAVVGDRAVCRTDCVAAGIDRVNLPRTESVSSYAVLQFMKSTLRALVSQGVNPDEVCFIFHKFIPATVAAWALAKPNQQLVLVDSLWGLPDGLQYLPHDTFEFDVRRCSISAETIRYKPRFLQEAESGEWKLINVARSVARHRSLPLPDLREVALQTHRIAIRLNKPIQIMWFCVVPESVGIGGNVPWFMMDPEPEPSLPSAPIAPNKERILITSISDLTDARSQRSGRFILSLEPDSDLFRSTEFLEQVARVSVEKDFPVAITGSLLSHAYYTLERKGVPVITDTSKRTRVRQRQVFRKLVRDEIPTKIAEHGEQANVAHIAKSESRTALVIKLFEEAQELLRANNPKDVTTELADLLEVVRSLAAATGADWDEVQGVADEKRKTRGSFARNVVLMETSWPKWAEANKHHDQQVIPLKQLGEITIDDGGHLLNFASVVAPGANNTIQLTEGVRISISVTDGGVRIAMVEEGQKADAQQLEFGFPRDKKSS
jgi:predicted house-cleaning noncanonical NTP pyrophosphatase (MazG superfamily)